MWRSGSESRRNLPRSALTNDSRLGVAEPSTHTAPARCAQMLDTSRENRSAIGKVVEAKSPFPWTMLLVDVR